MKKFLVIIFVLAVMASAFDDPKPPPPIDPAAQRQADIAKAHILCAAARSPNEDIRRRVRCIVNEIHQVIVLYMNTDVVEARKICIYTAEEAYKNNIDFGGRWQIRIMQILDLQESTPLATCTL